MQLQLDLNKTYAIALEGGGAKGGYEIGVWQALDEAGVKYNAVSGTSVGALNGALMAMRDLDRAVACWSNIRPSQVIDLGGAGEEEFKKLIDGRLEADDLQGLLPQAIDVIRKRGLPGHLHDGLRLDVGVFFKRRAGLFDLDRRHAGRVAGDDRDPQFFCDRVHFSDLPLITCCCDDSFHI